MRYLLLSILCLIVAPITATPLLAQTRAGQTEEVDDTELPAPASIASSSVGQVGQRQTREQVAVVGTPMQRINNRIANRVQSRLRNRIDRNYNPQANATSPFTIAEDQARTAGRPGR